MSDELVPTNPATIEQHGDRWWVRYHGATVGRFAAKFRAKELADHLNNPSPESENTP